MNYSHNLFINQDILLGGIENGQSLNRYAYVMGNPITGIDPEGRWVWWLVGIGAWVATEVIVPSFVQEAEFDSGEVIPSSFPDIIPIIGIAGQSVSQICRYTNATASNQVIAGITIDEANDLVDIYRGISQSHPGIFNAMQGIAIPRGGAATIYEHNLGNTNSEFTSWTINLLIARDRATIDGAGIVLHKQVKANDLITSPDNFDELEVLLRGTVKDANIFYCDDCF